MDNVPNTLLRPPTQLADHFHRVGHSWPSCSRPSWWFHVPPIWQEVVCNLVARCLSYSYATCRDARSLRRGKHRLYLWPGREADGSNETSTPSKTSTRDEMGRLEKVCRLKIQECNVSSLARFSLSRNTNEVIFPSRTGLILWLSERWRKSMR